MIWNLSLDVNLQAVVEKALAQLESDIRQSQARVTVDGPLAWGISSPLVKDSAGWFPRRKAPAGRWFPGRIDV